MTLKGKLNLLRREWCEFFILHGSRDFGNKNIPAPKTVCRGMVKIGVGMPTNAVKQI